jgi:hypothetical protein
MTSKNVATQITIQEIDDLEKILLNLVNEWFNKIIINNGSDDIFNRKLDDILVSKKTWQKDWIKAEFTYYKNRILDELNQLKLK